MVNVFTLKRQKLDLKNWLTVFLFQIKDTMFDVYTMVRATRKKTHLEIGHSIPMGYLKVKIDYWDEPPTLFEEYCYNSETLSGIYSFYTSLELYGFPLSMNCE